MFVKVELYSELSRAYMMEFFTKIVDGFQLFWQKASSQMFDSARNTPLKRLKLSR